MKRVSATPDPHAEALQVAVQLELAGLSREAQTLRHAIDGGSTATEILMALKWNLERIVDTFGTLDTELRERMKALIADLRILLAGA